MLVELVIDGRHRAAADRLLSRWATSTALRVVTAAHGLVEATSALRRLVARDEIAARAGVDAVDRLARLDLALDATAPRLRHICRCAAT